MLSSPFSFEENAVNSQGREGENFLCARLARVIRNAPDGRLLPSASGLQTQRPPLLHLAEWGGGHLPTACLAFMFLATSLVLHVFKRKSVPGLKDFRYLNFSH